MNVFIPLLLAFSITSSLAALNDIPVYLDAGCPNQGIPKSFAQGPSDMNLPQVEGGTAGIPITCTEALCGSDAAVLKLPRKLADSENYDMIFKLASDRIHSVKGYQDLRFWVKNRNSTVAKFRITCQLGTYQAGTYKKMEIAAGSNWTEYVIPLSELGATESIAGVQISNPVDTYGGADKDADPIDILIDSITVTDGTSNGSLSIPNVMHCVRPPNWPSTFLVGSFDNRDLESSTLAAQAGCAYRYQYMMPETRDYHSPSTKGYLYDYAMKSQQLGVKTAVVWYNLGKSGEGYDNVSANLQSSTYMTDYVDRYEWVLDQLEMAGQSDYMIIIEPDMYGFIMRGDKFHPEDVAVNMESANSVSGKTYPANLTGLATYLVERAREKLTHGVITGHMPNHWGANIPGQVGQGRKEAHIISGLTIGQFIKEMGPGMGDVVFVEKSDHDAGHKPAGENWFWDSTGYGKYFLWTRCIAHITGLPIVGWQISEGNMSNAATFRDDAVETFLEHPEWWVDGGFAGILFGAGNGCCCNYKNDNDGGWFVNNIGTYNKNPYPLPQPVVKTIPTGKLPGVLHTGNPVIRRFSRGVMIDGGFEGKVTVNVMTISGKLVSSKTCGNGDFVNLENLHPGLYMISARSGKKTAGACFVAGVKF